MKNVFFFVFGNLSHRGDRQREASEENTFGSTWKIIYKGLKNGQTGAASWSLSEEYAHSVQTNSVQVPDRMKAPARSTVTESVH